MILNLTSTVPEATHTLGTPFYVPMGTYAVTSLTPLCTYGYVPCMVVIIYAEITRGKRIGLLGHISANWNENSLEDKESQFARFLINFFKKLKPAGCASIILNDVYLIDGFGYSRDSDLFTRVLKRILIEQHCEYEFLLASPVRRLISTSFTPMLGGVIYHPISETLYFVDEQNLANFIRRSVSTGTVLNAFQSLVFLYSQRDHSLMKAYQPKLASKEAVNECFGCRTKFSPIIWKHNCKLCGQVFCDDCCNKTINYSKSGLELCCTPQVLSETFSKKHLICNNCYYFYVHV